MKTVIPRCRRKCLCAGIVCFWAQKAAGRKPTAFDEFRFNRVGSVLIVRRVQEVLADAEHVAGAHSQNNVARAGNAAQLGLDLRKRRVKLRARDLRGQIGRRNADGVFSRAA